MIDRCVCGHAKQAHQARGGDDQLVLTGCINAEIGDGCKCGRYRQAPPNPAE